MQQISHYLYRSKLVLLRNLAQQISLLTNYFVMIREGIVEYYKVLENIKSANLN